MKWIFDKRNNKKDGSAMEEMNKMDNTKAVNGSTLENVTPSEKVYVVNCLHCGAALKVKAGTYAYMCPVCNKLFSVRTTEKLVKEIDEEEKARILATETEEVETDEALVENKSDDVMQWDAPAQDETWEETDSDAWKNNPMDVSSEEDFLEEKENIFQKICKKIKNLFKKKNK